MHDLTTRPASTDLPRTTLIPRYLGQPLIPAPVPTGPATAELLLPLRPPLPRRLSPRRATRRVRATRWIQRNGAAAAAGIAVCVVAAHVIVTALTGGIQ